MKNLIVTSRLMEEVGKMVLGLKSEIGKFKKRLAAFRSSTSLDLSGRNIHTAKTQCMLIICISYSLVCGTCSLHMK